MTAYSIVLGLDADEADLARMCDLGLLPTDPLTWNIDDLQHYFDDLGDVEGGAHLVSIEVTP